MALQAIFFVIQNICVNYNPAEVWLTEKKNSFTGVFNRFSLYIQNSFLKCKFLFKDSVDRFGTTYLKNGFL